MPEHLEFDYTKATNAGMPAGYTEKYLPLVKGIRLLHPLTGQFVEITNHVTIDTGCEITLFHLDWAVLLDIELSSEEFTTIWKGVGYPTRLGKVSLQIMDDYHLMRWNATVSFAAIDKILLGYRGCLEFMDAHFLGRDRKIRLYPTPDFPGEITPPLQT